MNRRNNLFSPRKCVQLQSPASKAYRNQPKPLWVRREVIRLKALCPSAGRRAVAELFNRMFANSKNMTVSKSWGCTTWQQHRYDIKMERKRIRQRPALSWAKNQIWQVDLTQILDLEKQPQLIFGCGQNGKYSQMMVSKTPSCLLGVPRSGVRRFRMK